MKHLSFEDFLIDYHCRTNSEILDDDLPDAFSDWIQDLDPDAWIELGDKYANTLHIDLKGLSCECGKVLTEEEKETNEKIAKDSGNKKLNLCTSNWENAEMEKINPA